MATTGNSRPFAAWAKMIAAIGFVPRVAKRPPVSRAGRRRFGLDRPKLQPETRKRSLIYRSCSACSGRLERNTAAVKLRNCGSC